jgi:hypothetical protein
VPLGHMSTFSNIKYGLLTKIKRKKNSESKKKKGRKRVTREGGKCKNPNASLIHRLIHKSTKVINNSLRFILLRLSSTDFDFFLVNNIRSFFLVPTNFHFHTWQKHGRQILSHRSNTFKVGWFHSHYCELVLILFLLIFFLNFWSDTLKKLLEDVLLMLLLRWAML